MAKKAQGPGVGLESSEAIAARLDALETQMDRLRALYEAYFLGLDKRPPEVPRADLQRAMVETQRISIRNAALRFRFQTLQQRWTTYLNHWNRILREMENGTYRRDVARAQRRLAQRGETLGTEEAIALGIPVARAQAFVDHHNEEAVAHQHPTTVAAPSPPSSPAAELAGGPEAAASKPTTRQQITDGEIHGLIERWHLASKKLGKPDTAPTPEKLRHQLESQVERIRKERGLEKVLFDVATKDGKVVVRVKKAP